jgi:hypothetical protein
LDAEGHIVRVRSEVGEVDAFSISEGGWRWTEMIVIEWQETVGGEGRGSFNGGSGTLEQTRSLFMEG